MKMNIDFWPKNTKANFQNAQMNVSSSITMNYEQITMNDAIKNKPKQTQPVVSLSNLFQRQKNVIFIGLFS